MSGLSDRLADLKALAAVKDAVIVEQQTRLTAMTAEARYYRRVVAELTERVRRQSMTPLVAPSGDKQDE